MIQGIGGIQIKTGAYVESCYQVKALAVAQEDFQLKWLWVIESKVVWYLDQMVYIHSDQ